MSSRMRWTNLLNSERPRKFFDKESSEIVGGDSRTQFERDRDRTIFSTPMRRLIGKTQVFPLDQNDHVRTRLVHSLEVSTVAEGLATQCAREVIKKADKLNDEALRAIAKVAETCALMHDFGNPPFGHAGEIAIASWFLTPVGAECISLLGGSSTQLACDFLQFEGNAQTLRIVGNTHLIKHDRGLNLTCATLSAARKYLATSSSADRNAVHHEFTKPGFFYSEMRLLKEVESRTGTIGLRNPITYLVEAADDIVYSIVDLEDGIHKGLIDWAAVKASPIGETKFFKNLEKNVSTSLPPREYVQAFRVVAISQMVRAAVAQFGRSYEAIMYGEYHRELMHDPDCEAEPFIREAQRFLRKTVFLETAVLRLEVKGRRVIHDLMSLLWEGISARISSGSLNSKSYEGKIYHLLSPNYRTHFEKRMNAEEQPIYAGLQLLTDYVCNMTDPFACRLHREISNG